MNTAPLNASLIKTFGEAILVNKTGGISSINAIVERMAQNNALGGVVFNDVSLVLTLANADLASCPLEQINYISVRGTEYQAVEIIPDTIGGLATIKIRKF
jgi:hypothetical protein